MLFMISDANLKPCCLDATRRSRHHRHMFFDDPDLGYPKSGFCSFVSFRLDIFGGSTENLLCIEPFLMSSGEP